MKFILRFLLLIIFIVLFICLFFYSANILFAPSSGGELEPKVCFESHCFLVKLAKTAEAQMQGLMERQSLNKNEGMLFIFKQEGIYPFWMKNTLIPLDIIWISKEKKIVFINKNSQPCGTADCPIINPGVKAKYVLEINAGISEEIGLETGDPATFRGLAP